MFAKLIDDRSVLVGSTTGPSGAILDRTAAKFRALGYAVTRVPMADSDDLRGTDGEGLQTYTNSLFVNGVALVPQYGDGPADARALEVYRGLGISAVGIDSKALITFNGAIHCISMQIPKVD